MSRDDPHGGQPVQAAGAALEAARAAVILLHGRGGSAVDILSLAAHVEAPGVACLAPQAAGYTWYPHSFMAPLADNEPGLSSALRLVGALLEHTAAAGIAPQHTALLGFSQGACLALEYAARHARRYGGIIGLSGGLIGPPGTDFSAYAGSLAGTPLFLGCSDVDPHIPAGRVRESGAALAQLGATVDLRFYPGARHTVLPDELDAARAIVAGLVAAS